MISLKSHAETDELIKKIALKEDREGIVGTLDEMEIYFLCDKCKKSREKYMTLKYLNSQ